MKNLTFIIAFFSFSYVLSQSSVLSDGNWYRVGVTESGIYKMDGSALTTLGMDINSIDPRTIKIYGSDIQGMLPQANHIFRSNDPVEFAIFVQGEDDGSFRQSDYILFYAPSPDKSEWTRHGFSYQKNLYSDTAYYFVTTGGEKGKRLTNKPSLAQSGLDVSSYDEALIFEEDLSNLIRSGRQWLGELFLTGESQTYHHTLNGISSDIELVFSGVSQSLSKNFFAISANAIHLGNLKIDSIKSAYDAPYGIKARQSVDTFLIDQTSDLSLKFTYDSDHVSAIGYLDYYALLFKRTLRVDGTPISFRITDQVGNVLNYRLQNANNLSIWDVTNPSEVRSQSFTLSGNQAMFQSQSDEVEEYIAFTDTDFPSPALFGRVANQNLKGAFFFDAIIVSHPDFLTEANRLAQFHRSHDGLSVHVVVPRQIYNEFSCGRQDLTAIRDYAKYVYDSGLQLKYLLLFGDDSFDYKSRESKNTNFVPTYESRESFHPIFSYSSDDYFGFFEHEEGEWLESSYGDHTLEIGVGRLPAKTLEEAKTMVDKIIYYSTSPNTLGKWKNEVVYFADDEDRNIHVQQVDSLSKLIDTTHHQYSIDKLLLDAFEQVGTIQTSPVATRALKTKIKNGVFAVNFLGHGSPRQWTEERVLTKSLIDNLNNRNRMPIFVTATCEFGRHDDPGETSGAEELLLNQNGGAIALLTTSRPVYASTNFLLNQVFHEHIFRKKNGQYQRLGDIIKLTKNGGLAGVVNRNFTLLGDPMMLLAYPQLEITLNELAFETDTLSALEEATFTGQVISNGSIRSDFNGTLSVSIFDIEQQFKTKGQGSSPFVYALRNNAIFRGEASVKNGLFSFTFIVPKNISYQFKRGRINLYAWDETSNLDANGANTQFVLGGTSPNLLDDTLAPEVDLYLNDETFVNGSTVSRSSLLIAHVRDENGISITSQGLSQGISLELGGEIINLNQFYTADLDTYQSGTIIYPIQEIEPGVYTATLNVYDSYNNLAKKTITFKVSDASTLYVYDVKVFPNPTVGQTTFSFEHDREEEDLNIKLMVYDAQGYLINQTNYMIENSDRAIRLKWEALTNSGQPLAPGIYFCRLIIRSQFDGAIKEITNRIVISRN